MKKFLKISLISIIFVIAIFLLNEVHAANLSVNVDFDGKEIEMTSETPDMTWSIENLLPGETDETLLTIYNIGTRQANVKFLASIENGGDLAEVLNIKIIKLAGEVQKEDEEFFDGKYSELMNMGLDLAAGKAQSYKIITSLPIETGNEYQNKECKIKLSFVASGIEDKEEPVIPEEPTIPEEPEQPDIPQAPEEDPPKEIITDVIKPVQTGESKTVYIVVTVLVIAIVVLVITYFIGKKKDK